MANGKEFDWEMESAKEAGVLAVAELENKRESAPVIDPVVLVSRYDEARRTAYGLLEEWADAVISKAPLADPVTALRRASGLQGGGVRSSELTLRRIQYVEGTFGFWGVRPILVWHVGRGLPLSAYEFLLPGETPSESLLRHGMGQDLIMAIGSLTVQVQAVREAAARCYQDFEDELTARVSEDPPPDRLTKTELQDDPGYASENEAKQAECLQVIRQAGNPAKIRDALVRLKQLRGDAKR